VLRYRGIGIETDEFHLTRLDDQTSS